ncbi:MAG: NFACT family protein [Anaeroplasmataceae bacterium]|nr:NFACT family protein [Anaeroplasmataceae bacterium]
MSFDGVFLHKLIQELNILKTGRITKVMESGDTDFILVVRSNHQNHSVMISLSSDYARIHLTNKTYDAPTNPRSLTMLLRKHIEGFFIEDLYQYKNDRIVVFKLAGYNEMRDFTHKYLICEIMGRYSNLILTEERYKILEVLKHTGVTEFGRTMLPNATYLFPEGTKLNPFDLSLKELENLKIESPKDLCIKLEGVSIALANYAFTKEQSISYFYDLLHQVASPSIFTNTQGKKDFYYIPLSNLENDAYSSLSALLDDYYYQADNQSKIKLKTNDLVSFIQRQIHKNEKKIKKLTAEALEASHAEEYKIKGELLLSYPNLKAKEAKVSIFNYYTNQEEIIDLDIKYDIITNSQKYYKKYQKTKTAIHYIEDQLRLSESEIEYFQMLLEQLKCASINDAIEIRQELIENRYLLDTPNKSKKKAKPNYLTYIVDDTLIYVGKNNLQNEYLTHKLAKSTDYWFHVQNASGSHVIVCANELTENLCRTAAMLAANYSSLNESSSIPVDYTLVRNIKKIPGKRNCFVTYTKQKTIYIDIDKKILDSLKVKK